MENIFGDDNNYARALMDRNVHERAPSESSRLVHPAPNDLSARPVRTLDLPSDMTCDDVADGVFVRDYRGVRRPLAVLQHVNSQVARSHERAAVQLNKTLVEAYRESTKLPVDVPPAALPYVKRAFSDRTKLFIQRIEGKQLIANRQYSSAASPSAAASPASPAGSPAPPSSSHADDVFEPEQPSSQPRSLRRLGRSRGISSSSININIGNVDDLFALPAPPLPTPVLSYSAASATAAARPADAPVKAKSALASRPQAPLVHPLSHSEVARAFLPGLAPPPPPQQSVKRKAVPDNADVKPANKDDDDDDDDDATLADDQASVDMMMPPSKVPAAAAAMPRRVRSRRSTPALACMRRLGYHDESAPNTVLCHHHACESTMALPHDDVAAKNALRAAAVERVYRAHEWQTFMCAEHKLDMTALNDKRLAHCCHACARPLLASQVPMLHNALTDLTLNLCAPCCALAHVQSQLARYRRRINSAPRKQESRARISAAPAAASGHDNDQVVLCKQT